MRPVLDCDGAQGQGHIGREGKGQCSKHTVQTTGGGGGEEEGRGRGGGGRGRERETEMDREWEREKWIKVLHTCVTHVWIQKHCKRSHQKRTRPHRDHTCARGDCVDLAI